MKLKAEFDAGSREVLTPEYRRLSNTIRKLSCQIGKAEGAEKERLLAEYRAKRKLMLRTPCSAQTRKCVKYVRYADDFIIAVKGSKADCQWIKERLSKFISQTLKMELSEEKTLITHSSQYARFLGYNIRIRRSGVIKRGGPGRKPKRTLNNACELSIPFDDKIHDFIFARGIAEQEKDGTLFPVCRVSLLHLTDLEIISVYNAELRGICNYYGLAVNFSKLGYLGYLMEYSCLKTLAAKHKSSISKIKAKFKDGKGRWGVPYETKAGSKRRYFVKYAECRGAANPTDIVSNAAIVHRCSRTTLEARLKAKVCELCGATDSKAYEIHSVKESVRASPVKKGAQNQPRKKRNFSGGNISYQESAN